MGAYLGAEVEDFGLDSLPEGRLLCLGDMLGMVLYLAFDGWNSEDSDGKLQITAFQCVENI
jgi:hypothetical protein